MRIPIGTMARLCTVSGWLVGLALVTPTILLAEPKMDAQESREMENAETPKEPQFKLKPVVVKERIREAGRLKNPVPQTGINREEIEIRNNRRAGDVIRRLPGVFMGGPPGENKDIRFRGLDKEFTRVQVDGVQLPGGGEKREFQVNRLPSFMVDTITIIRSPTSEYESDGLAGRVDIRTRPIPTVPTASGRFGYGGRNDIDGDLINGNFGFGYRPTDWFGVMGTVDHLDQQLLKSKRKTFTPTTAGKSEIEEEPKEQVSTNVNIDLGFYYPQGEFHLKPTVLNLNEDKDKTKLTADAKKTADKDEEKEDETEEKLQRTTGLGVSHKHLFPNAILMESIAGYYKTEEDKDKNKLKFKEAASAFVIDKTELEKEDKEDRTWNVSTKLTIPFELGLKQVVKTGGAIRLRDRFRDKFKQEIDKNGKLKITSKPKDTYFLEEDYFAGFIQDQIWLTERLSLLPGVRLEHVNLTTRSGGTPSQKTEFTDTNPSVHLLYQVLDNLSLRAAFSRSVNRPKFDELAPFEQEEGSKIKVGNPNLQPAASYNYDVGGEFVMPYGFFGLNLFHKDIKDVIEEVGTGIDKNGKDIFMVENVGDGWTRGIELEERFGLSFLDFGPLQGVSIWANQSFFESELKNNTTGVKQRFKDQPKFLSNLGLDYTYLPWGTTVTIAWNYVGEQIETKADGTRKINDSTSTVDLSARQRLYDNIYLFFEAGNLTNAGKNETEFKTDGTFSRKTEDVGQSFLLGLTWVPGQQGGAVVNPFQ